MASSNNCILKITSHVINFDENGKPDGTPEKDELLLNGTITKTKDNTSLSYKEERDGSSVFCEIQIKGETVTVKRRGAVSCDMIFTVGKTYKTLYNVPPFSFDMEITASRIENSINTETGALTLFYDMTVGGAKKRCRMKIQREK